MTAVRVLALHLGAVAVLGVLQFVLPPFHHGMLARILILSTYAIGYNLLFGYTGLLSLGHAVFFAAGMYGAGLPVYYWGTGSGVAFLLGLGSGLLLAAAVGALSLRASGAAFPVVTMMFGQVGYLLTLHFNRITFADQGLVLADRLLPLHLGPWTIPLTDPVVRYALAWGLCTVGLFGSLWIVRSPFGRALVALREHEERARMLGYDPFRYRWVAVCLSGAMAGAAGAAYALSFGYVGNAFASILYSIYPLLWVLLGGAGTVLGPVVGVLLMTYAVDVTSGFTSAYLVVVGLALVLVTLGFPQGILGSVRTRWWRWLP